MFAEQEEPEPEQMDDEFDPFHEHARPPTNTAKTYSTPRSRRGRRRSGGTRGCQMLGDEPDVERPAATIIAPAKPEQLIAQRVTAAAVRERRTPCCPSAARA